MELITGRTGSSHVYAADDAELYKLFLGNGDYVLPTGRQLAATMNDTTQIRISDGSLITQGRLAKIRQDTGYDALTLDVGTVGYKRVDLVVAEYEQTVTQTEQESGGEIVIVEDRLENVTLKIIKGTPNATQYVEPDITTGNIDDGEIHQIKLWAVQLDGINFNALIDYRVFLTSTPIQTLLDTANAYYSQMVTQMENLQNELYDYADELRSGITGTVAGYYKIANVNPYQSAFTVSSNRLNVAISGYTYADSDAVEMYLNGLRLNNGEYSVHSSSSGTTLVFVLTEYTTNAAISDMLNGNTVEVVVLKVGE